MANLDRPKGFDLFGAPIRLNEYESGSAVYPGELVNLASDGQVDAASAGGLILGLCLSYASAAGQKIVVADSPDQLIVGQADETEIDAQTDIGNMCDIVATAENTTYNTSRMEVDSSTVSANAAQLQILRIVNSPKNALGAQCEVVCRINEHQLGDAIAGV